MSEGLVILLVIFVLAMFVGFEVITKVPTTLHTPLMSGSNALSGITIIGAMIVAGMGATTLATILGVTAVVFAMINVVGGYVVTDRMLQMFKKRPEAEFIIGLKRLAAPATARQGNLLSAVGMLIAIVATLFDQQILSFQWIVVGGVIGSALGLWMARTVKMTAMPQMVGVLNGLGGGASQLVAAAVWHRLMQPGAILPLDTAVSIYASTFIGGVTLSGSIVAAGKLQEIIPGRPVLFRFQHLLNLILLLAWASMGTYLLISSGHPGVFITMNVMALILGVLVVIPIGGADMPVVICLLNSYSGLAAATTGFVISNHGLIISGALVGASGIILTQIMCRAMNRSFTNVLFGGFGAVSEVALAGGTVGPSGKSAQEISAEDVSILLAYARSVIITPGYGLAVAQAQHQVRELDELLEKRGVEVKYAIHPVAGRMPGHMNVLLGRAHAGSYERAVGRGERAVPEAS